MLGPGVGHSGCRPGPRSSWSLRNFNKIDSVAAKRHHSSEVRYPDLENARTIVYDVLENPNAPVEEEVLDALRSIELCVLELVDRQNVKDTQQSKSKLGRDTSSTTAMLSLDDQQGSSMARSSTSNDSLPDSMLLNIKDDEAQGILSELSYTLLAAPLVSITENILAQYVQVQSLLSRPISFPEAFNLYAYKPAPLHQNSTVRLDSTQRHKHSPNGSKSSSSSAVPEAVAENALNTALRVRSLPLALSIVENSYATSSFRWSKFLRRALPPTAGVCFTPFAAYTLAARLAEHQTGLSTESFTQIAFAGMFTYTVCVGTIGWVALATANDQMQRVTWAEGTPLWERWVREDERAALDRVACAWGLREKWRWGEEEGKEWDHLREWIGLKGMILDKVSLMEGMQ
ncbi:MAG: hypothetical protein M1831_005930 [Alyxoria varia]|nr:MAG: hypothetical protein M1831_005930 [Alyxoria varia]